MLGLLPLWHESKHGRHLVLRFSFKFPVVPILPFLEGSGQLVAPSCYPRESLALRACWIRRGAGAAAGRTAGEIGVG